MTSQILVTGGAGYIGSHVVAQLIEQGHHIVVLDNFYSGHRWAVHPKAKLFEGSVADSEKVESILKSESIRSVLHFAAHIEVAESVELPMKYYGNNTVGTFQFIQTCARNGVEHFIFSSTAAVYGEPKILPVDETAPVQPLNPYGWSKFFSEQMIRDFLASPAVAGKMRAVILRYFNVAGAKLDGTLGQATPRATHLIKVACETAIGMRPSISVFGTDYPTPDGTCIRDYIHVDDLASAHLLALNYLKNGGSNELFNCGYGHGFSVKEVLETIQAVNGKSLTIRYGERRPGDSPAIVADSSKIRRALGWTPQYDDLKLICKTALDWERSLQKMARP